MKTAVSLPDILFERGERVARAMNINRSQLYARALQAYLDRHDTEAITAAFNAVYATEPSELDPLLWDLQLATLTESGNEEW